MELKIHRVTRLFPAALSLYSLVIYFCWRVGLKLARAKWELIHLRFSNPLEVVGPLTQLQFNPTTNLLRYIFFVGMPACLFALIFLVSRRKFFFLERFRSPGAARDPRCGMLSGVSVAILVLFGLTGILSFVTRDFTPWVLDFFHEGEYLTPAKNFMKTGGIWSRSYFVHGAFYDPLSTVLGWKIFGIQSVGAGAIVNSAGYAVLPAALAIWFLALGANRRGWRSLSFNVAVQALLFAWFISVDQFQVLDRRDLPVLIGAVGMVDGLARRSPVLLAGAGLMSAASYFYSIDRGAYYTATFLFFTLLARDRRLIAGSALGFAAGWAIFITGVGRLEFSSFLSTTGMLYKTKDLFDSYIYTKPSLSLTDPGSLTMMLIAMQILLFGFRGLRQHYKGVPLLSGWGKEHLLLLVLSFFYYRSALGRSDEGHVRYASTFPFFGCALFAAEFALEFLRTEVIYVLTIVLLVFNLGSLRSAYAAYPYPHIATFPARVRKFVARSDHDFLNPEQIELVGHLKQLLNGQSCFFGYTSEAVIPYLLDLPSCSRFFIVWFASPRPNRNALLADLAATDPPYILFHSKSWTNNIDLIDNAHRFPDVDARIRELYEPFENLHGWEIYKKKVIPRG